MVIFLYFCRKFQLNSMLMKKTLFLLAMCLVGMCSMYAVSVVGTPIQFVEIYGVMPCDDAEETVGGGRPDPNRVIGGIDGNDLNIGIVDNGSNGDVDTGDAGDVIVIDPETGDIIVEEGFVGQTSVNIPEPGSYTAYVVVDGVTYAGDFVVE